MCGIAGFTGPGPEARDVLAKVRREREDLRRERLRLRMDHVQRAHRHLVIGEHAHDAPRGELGPRDERWKRADAEAKGYRFSDEEEIVPAQTRPHHELRGALRARDRELVRVAWVEADRVVVVEVLQTLR